MLSQLVGLLYPECMLKYFNHISAHHYFITKIYPEPEMFYLTTFLILLLEIKL